MGIGADFEVVRELARRVGVDAGEGVAVGKLTVTALGAQSSGKSALINRLFGLTVRHVSATDTDTHFTVIASVPDVEFRALAGTAAADEGDRDHEGAERLAVAQRLWALEPRARAAALQRPVLRSLETDERCGVVWQPVPFGAVRDRHPVFARLEALCPSVAPQVVKGLLVNEAFVLAAAAPHAPTGGGAARAPAPLGTRLVVVDSAGFGEDTAAEKMRARQQEYDVLHFFLREFSNKSLFLVDAGSLGRGPAGLHVMEAALLPPQLRRQGLEEQAGAQGEGAGRDRDQPPHWLEDSLRLAQHAVKTVYPSASVLVRGAIWLLPHLRGAPPAPAARAGAALEAATTEEDVILRHLHDETIYVVTKTDGKDSKASALAAFHAHATRYLQTSFGPPPLRSVYCVALPVEVCRMFLRVAPARWRAQLQADADLERDMESFDLGALEHHLRALGKATTHERQRQRLVALIGEVLAKQTEGGRRSGYWGRACRWVLGQGLSAGEVARLRRLADAYSTRPSAKL